MPDLPRFYTFATSHYCEKARWAMDFAEIIYDERPQTPVLHIPNILRISKSKNSSVPLLIDGDTMLQDSTAIMRWADAKAPEKGLFAAAKPGKSGKVSKAAAARAEKQRAEIEATIERYDGMGQHVRRFSYGHLIDDRKRLLMALTWASAPLQSVALKAYYPLVKASLKKAYNITPESAARSRQVVLKQLDEIAAAVAKTGYLCGEDVTAADLAVASLLAPVAMPEEQPVYRALRKHAAAPVAELSQHPAMEWAREIYRKHRYENVV